MGDRSADGTATLDKALDVLDAVGESTRGLSQAELSARLSLPRTTLYRLLGTLVDRGLLRRDPLRRVYCLGFRSFEYARRAYAMPDLVAAASVELRMLRDLTGETTYLATLDGLEVLSLERCDGAHSQRSSAALGQRKPLHCTSQGKAILAALPAPERDALIKDLPMQAMTPHTITERRKLQAELKVTAARGYAIDDEEIALGVRCCGAPIIDGAGRVRGSISVAGPAFRLTMARVELLGPEVAQAARRIGAQLDAARARPSEESVTVIDGPWAFHGAFARWSRRDKCLYWADTLAPAIQRCDDGVDRCIATLSAPVLAMLQCDDGLLVMQQDAWLAVDADGSVHPAKGLPRRRMQALCAAPDGAPWACAGDGERWRVGALLADGTLRGGWSLDEAVTAMAWDANGGTLYAIAPDSGTVYMLRPGSATVRRLASVPKGSGRLSGLALDNDGGVWTALKDGWSVVRLSADGALDRVVGLPVPCPTDLAFGGASGASLFVVSSRDAVSMEALAAAPLSGRLFELKPDVAGMPDHVLSWA
jgi:IclR family transcriptional regulator, acetate operon repressor